MVDFITNPNIMLVLMDGVVEYLFFCMHRTFYSRKEWFNDKNKLVAFVYFVMFVVYSTVNSLGIVPLNMTATLASYFVPLFIIYKVDSIRGIIYFAFYIAIMIALETGEAFIMGITKDIHGNRAFIDQQSPVSMMLLLLSEIMAARIICYFGSKENNKRLDRASVPFILPPIFTTAIIMIDTIRVGNSDELNVFQFSEMTVILTLLNILFFIILEKYSDSIRKEMTLRQSELQLKSDADIMEIATKNMRERLVASEEVMKQDRAMRHDRRHFEALLMSLLDEGKYEEARQCLTERLEQEPHPIKRYCENTTVNAAIGHYVEMAKKQNIKVTVAANIPAELQTDEMQLAIAISNLIENAIHACERLPEEERFIEINAKYKSQLLLEITNSCKEKVELDEDGHPFSTADDHGIGTRSVLAFVHQTQSDIRYIAEDRVFKVRMIIN